MVIEGVPISPGLIKQLKDLQDFGPSGAKNCIARSSLFIASIPGDCEQIDKDFYVLQEIFYQVCMEINGESNNEGKEELS